MALKPSPTTRNKQQKQNTKPNPHQTPLKSSKLKSGIKLARSEVVRFTMEL